MAQLYGNEGYEKEISSVFRSRDTIHRDIIEYHGPRNAQGFMDENSKQNRTEEKYIIDDSGKIIQIQ